MTASRKYIPAFATALIMAAATSCGSDPEPEPVNDTARSVLVYIVANNSLGSSGRDIADIEEMTRAAMAGDLGGSRLILYHAPRSAAPELKEVTAEGVKTLKQYDLSASSVSSQRMNEVIKDFKQAAPANTYGLVLWSHASGWLENGIETETASPTSFGDDGQGRYMNVTTLANVLDGKGFEYVYFDCCYMASVEVAYQLKDCTDFIVGSATELPANGMPYDKTLRYLMAEDADLQKACEETFESYNSLAGENRTCTISLIDTSSLDRLASATKAIYERHTSLPEGYSPQPFMLSNCYLYDFGQYAETLADSPDLLNEYQQAMSQTVLYKRSTPMLWNRITIEYHSGLSTYIMEAADDSSYRNYNRLSWWNDVASSLFK